jgi:hydroxypyruvate isomerase
MKLSVCIDALYKGRNFIESLHDISSIGIDTFEFWSWWNKDIRLIQETKEELNLGVSTFCTKFISLVDQAKREEYIHGLLESIEVAKKLNCKTLITQVGNELHDISREVQHHNLVEGLQECAPILEKEGITLLVEPLNTIVNHKGYYLYRSARLSTKWAVQT